jgi:hypothetical protein
MRKYTVWLEIYLNKMNAVNKYSLIKNFKRKDTFQDLIENKKRRKN